MKNTINTKTMNQVQEIMLSKRQKIVLEFIGSENTQNVGENARLALTLQANLEAYGYGFTIETLKGLSNASTEELTQFNKWFIPALEESVGAHRQYNPMYPNFPQQVFDATETELVMNALMHYTGDMIGIRILPYYDKKVRTSLKLNETSLLPEGFVNSIKDVPALKEIKFGSVEDVRALFVELLNMNTALSISDREAVDTLFTYFKETDELEGILSGNEVKISNKENLAHTAKLVVDNKVSIDAISSQFATSTDVLRFAVALSDGDLSLAEKPKFKNLKRPARRAVLSLLNEVVARSNEEAVLENMFQKRDIWVRLGEKLHPSEYQSKYKLSADMFDKIRNEDKPTNFNGKVDIAIDRKDFNVAIELLKSRPGIFARSLNRLLQRIEGNEPQPLVKEIKAQPQFNNMFNSTPAKPVETVVKSKLAEQLATFKPEKHGKEVMAFEPVGKEIVEVVNFSEKEKEALIAQTIIEFSEVAKDVSTPVLLQVYNHFKTQGDKEKRIFLPKGMLAKAFITDNNVEALSGKIADDISFICRNALVERFKELPSLGKVYVDPELKEQNVPFAMRSASKALKTVARGSQINLAENGEDPSGTTRFFVWWHDMETTEEQKANDPHGYYNPGRVDIDLSVVFMNEEFNYVNHCSFTNLRGDGFAHSGDITSAPNGACEFIDINKKNLDPNIKYMVMVINSYTDQPYYDLPECFAGWMERDRPQDGEIYEPRTVKNKFDLTSDSKTVLPMIIDIHNNKAIWADLSIKTGNWWNMIENQNKTIQHMVQSMVYLSKPNLYDLFEMHAHARGEVVSDKKDAETIFSLHEGITPYEYETIASEFMADKVETPKPKLKMK